MTLLTVDEFREHAPTTLVDAAIQRILDASEAEIIRYAGPVGVAVTELVDGGSGLLVLSRPLGTVSTITETYGSTTVVTLTSDDWRQRNPYVLDRLNTGTNPRSRWYGLVTVTYTPADDTAIRKMVQVDLAKLTIATNPGLASQTIGSWTEQYAANSAWNPEEARASMLGRLRDPSIGVV